MTEQAVGVRDERGRWPAGVSGNPRGRPRKPRLAQPPASNLVGVVVLLFEPAPAPAQPAEPLRPAA
jgi:hypothetical protein